MCNKAYNVLFQAPKIMIPSLKRTYPKSYELDDENETLF